jgi:alpha-L-fucosidase 2
MDTVFLRETAYPIIKEAAMFWIENLVEYQGYLIAGPSISAEHGAYIEKDGATGYNIPGAYQDAQMIGDLFKNCLRGAEILDVDEAFGDSVREYYTKLLPPKIGRHGQLQEWYEDLDSPEDRHRHISHLYALCPGSDIHPLTTPELAEAAKISLNMRGDGRFPDVESASGGNWSRAWRIWSWTRLMDGAGPIKFLQKCLQKRDLRT